MAHYANKAIRDDKYLAPCQCLATFTPLKSEQKKSWRHFSARSSFYIINWLDSVYTQEVPMKKYLKEIVGPVFEIYAIELLS